MEEKTIYSKISEVRQAKGISVNTLAEKIGEDHQKVGRIERGQRSLTIDYLMKVSKALDTPLKDFVSDEPVCENNEPNEHAKTIDVLSEIVMLMEENHSHFSQNLDPKKKGKLISKIYEQALKFPENQQRLFLRSFFECLKIIP
mgnify:CR=1 FL=1